MPESAQVEESIYSAETRDPETALPVPETTEDQVVFLRELEKQVTAEIDDFAVRVDGFIANIDTGTPEGQTALTEMQAVKTEASKATTTFWEHLAKIVGHPIHTYREHQQEKKVIALALPDNPKIITALKKRLRAIEKAMEFANKQWIKARNNKQKNDLPPNYKEKIYKDLDLLFSDLEQATKSDQNKWHNIENEIKHVIAEHIHAALVQSNTNEALTLFNYYPGHKDDGTIHSLAESIVLNINNYEFESLHKKLDADDKTYSKTRDSFMKTRLSDHPDLYALYIKRFYPGYIYQDKTRYYDALDEIKKCPDRSWVVNKFIIGDEVVESSLDQATSEQLFTAYLASKNITEIIRNIQIFKPLIENLNPAKRSQFMENSTDSFSFDLDLLGKLMSEVRLSSTEFEKISKKLRFTSLKDLQQSIRNPHAILLNGDCLGYSDEEKIQACLDIFHQNQLFGVFNFEQDSLVWQKILMRRTGCTDQLKEKIDITFVNFLKLLNSSQYFPIVQGLKEKGLLSSEWNEIWLNGFTDRRNNREIYQLCKDFPDLIPTNLLEETHRLWMNLSHVGDIDTRLEDIVAGKIKLDESQMEYFLNTYAVKTYDILGSFQKLFITEQKLDDRYAEIFITRICLTSNSGQFLNLLKDAFNLGKLTDDRYDKFITLFVQHADTRTLQNNNIFWNTPELEKAALFRIGTEGTSEEVKHFLENSERNTANFTPEEIEMVVNHFCAILPRHELYDAMADPKRYFLTEDNTKIIDRLAKNKNYDSLFEMLLIPNIGLTTEQHANIWDTVQRDGSALVLINRTQKIKDGFFTDTEITRWQEAVVAKANPLQLINLLEADVLTDEQSIYASGEILKDGETHKINRLYSLYCRQPNILSNQQEKLLFDKIIDLGLTNVMVAMLLNKENTNFPVIDITQAILYRFKEDPTNVSKDIFNLLSSYQRIKGAPLEKTQQKLFVDCLVSTDLGIKLYINYLEQANDDNNQFDLSTEQIKQTIDSVLQTQLFSDLLDLVKHLILLNDEQKKLVHLPDQTQKTAIIDHLLKFGASVGSFDTLNQFDTNLFRDRLQLYIQHNGPEHVMPYIIGLKIAWNDETLAYMSNYYDQIIQSGSFNQLESLSKVDKVLFLQRIDFAMANYRQSGKNTEMITLTKYLFQLHLFDEKYISDFVKILGESELTPRAKQIAFAGMIGSIIESDHIPSKDEMSANTSESKEDSSIEKLRQFADKYHISEKGLTILTLVAARDYTDDQPFEAMAAGIIRKLKEYEKILDLSRPEIIPTGIHASIGMEYEITHSIGAGYGVGSVENNLKSDILELSSIAHIGQGCDALHEIATKPTDNPYAMLLEMKLLQDLGFFDFNFEQSGYELGSRGYHLTIGGEEGLQISPNTNFLQNILVASSWGGVNSGKDVDKLSSGRRVNIRQREEYQNIKVFKDRSPTVELRALSIDRWEPFERSVLTAYHGAIAIQAMEKFAVGASITNVDKSSVDEYYKTMITSVDKDARLDEKTKAIILAWIELMYKTEKSLQDHNENFLANETTGYFNESDDWVEPAEWGGAENIERFQSVIHNIDPEKSVGDYSAQTTLSPSDFFDITQVSLANKITKINNLFLKPATVMGGDRANALAMLSTTKLGNGQVEMSTHRALSDSIFDKKGLERRGYYNVQGASERMITHALQKHLLEFNRRMKEIISMSTATEKHDLRLAA